MKSAIGGFTVWLVLLKLMTRGYAELTWIDALFLFAPLAIVPLGLELTSRLERGISPSALERLARICQVPAAYCAAAAFLFSPGRIAGSLAGVYLLFCAALGLAGLGRIFRGGYRRLQLASPAVAFLSLPIGGAWLVASRLGLQPLGFHEPIVLLTAVHFHYAGFAAAMMVRPVARVVAPADSNGDSRGAAVRVFRVFAVGVLLGPAMLAIGFLLGPQWKLVVASLLALSEVALAIAFVASFRRVMRAAVRLLLGAASASMVVSMVYAVIWAVGEYPLQPFVGIPTMALVHGSINAFGFALCGLLGWTLAAGESATHAEGMR